MPKVEPKTLEEAMALLRKLKLDLMKARRGEQTLANYRNACTAAEHDIEVFITERRLAQYLE